jgi:putative nucleotidyltransferase with HDIG domain
MGSYSETKAKVFIGAVIAFGGAAILHSLFQLYALPPHPTWLLLGALTLISGLFTIAVPSVSATISVSETFIFTSVLLFGTPVATIIVAFEALLMSSLRHRHEARKVLFNMTEPALSIWIASNVFFLFVSGPLRTQPQDIATLLGPMLLLTATYFFLNSWLTATAVGFVSKLPIQRIWRQNFSWLSLNYLVGASVALIIVQSAPTVGLTTLGIILPLLALSYFTNKSAMGRLDDANRHIAQVERLYLSTVESLAMAIDAKDQVTHGHIRRVQTLATGLAKELGLKHIAVLRAIESAALLHDMGKLAVPEYILNKPGKLTATEFEKMKLHASIGAEILSSIDFPYPVVPIVRHHHENWDGSGYPDGVSGANIPIGARILSVVDCFDALTSDRPYRRRMADAEAVRVLQQRRGTMYDPLVVDTFVNAYERIRPAEQTVETPLAYNAITRSGQSVSLDESNSLFADSAPAALRLEAAIVSSFEPQLALIMFERYLGRLFPSGTSAVYGLDDRREELTITLAIGVHKDFLTSMTVAIGSGVSGWVAANHHIAINSDPVLDFGHDRIRLFKYCISAPILDRDGQLLGVITTYSDSEPFPNEDCEKLGEAALVGSMILALNFSRPYSQVSSPYVSREPIS